MGTLSSRHVALIGAFAATVLLLMQLSTEGVAGYRMGDVLSILIAVVPVVLHATRTRQPHRRLGADRQAAPPRGAAGSAVVDGAPAEAGAADGPRAGDVSSTDDVAAARPAAADADPNDERIMQRLLTDGAAVLLAAGMYVVTVALVLLQAWPAALSALIIFVVAAATVSTGHDARPDRAPTQAGRTDRP